MMMLLVDGAIYLLIAAYVTAVFPGEFGVPKHPLFFLGCLHSIMSCKDATLAEADAASNPKRSRGIIISSLTKSYKAECSSAEVLAVQDFSVSLYPDQITTLLGSNGAGKTTTMSIITGLFPQTGGHVLVNGRNTRTDIDAIRRTLGLCPQHNVLFPWMTPVEHLAFCAAMRGMPKRLVKSATAALLDDLGLSASHNVRACNLSGGQKRKLSVAMAFMGDPEVVILDEPTAGMDPSARRQTWDVVLARRAGRTIMLSTHYLDEADLLSDRIAIMSRGRLLCVDTPMQLKKEFGSGYCLSLDVTEDCRRAGLRELVCRHVPEARLVQSSLQEIVYSLPIERLPAFQQLFRDLEAGGGEMGIGSFGISAPTIDEVFKTAIEQDDEEAIFTPDAGKAGMDSDSTKPVVGDLAAPVAVTGWTLTVMQFKAMLLKRVQHAKRDKKAIFSQLILPVGTDDYRLRITPFPLLHRSLMSLISTFMPARLGFDAAISVNLTFADGGLSGLQVLFMLLAMIVAACT